MKKAQQLILFSTLLLTLLSCKKNDPPETSNEPVLPPMTQEGLNTFGCYIDGKLFVANDGLSVWSIPPVSGSFDEGDKHLKLQGTRYKETNSEKNDFVTIEAFVDNLNTQLNYEIYDGDILGYRESYNERCDYFYYDIPDLGYLSINYLDKEKNIIAGTFYMTLINPDCEGDTVMNISDGRFDFRY